MPSRMTLLEAVRSSLRKTFTYSGRARRAEYWYWTLAAVLVYAASVVVDSVLGSEVISTCVLVLVMLPSFAVTVRRLHDIDRSGWWLLVGAIPIVGDIMMLVWAVTDGTQGMNRYGPSPKYHLPVTTEDQPAPA